MHTSRVELKRWVDEVASLCRPKAIHWCDGSEEEYDALANQMLQSGDLIKLNEKKFPNCYLHRSDPNDVARTEHLTFVCTNERETAGPNNNWMSPVEGHKKVDALFNGAMEGRTLYVVPYCMGPINSPLSRCGVEITDSPYVVMNMRIMTRMGSQALKRIEEGGPFVRGLHSTGDLSIDKRLIMHFPEELVIKSVGSGYGGNALLGKKCHALRIGSFQARSEGWLAEHMLIVGIENPQGKKTYIAAAFPSACGKTNLAMLIPPEKMRAQGWKVWTVGDDIAWMHRGEDGRLYAINPEAGFFGVAPGTSAKTNPNALNMLKEDCIFTNVAVTEDNEPWWEGIGHGEPAVDWQGRPYDRANGPAAHPNSRFTVSAGKCASYTKEAENPQGVPISAIIFGGRRPSLIPLVTEALDWTHGVLMGASVASETTAAATGKVGVLRHDPMAMKPFCGYNFADYWGHWLSFADNTGKLPKIFNVNWFRQEGGKFLWPGFGENMRVLEWIIDRCNGEGEARRTPIGYLPTDDSLNLEGLDLKADALAKLLTVEPDGWVKEIKGMQDFFANYGDRVPVALKEEQARILDELNG
ncbi:MAG: phosphoenolpyruvate carboxykinase (GTP) [Bdellovibrionota bacterium]